MKTSLIWETLSHPLTSALCTHTPLFPDMENFPRFKISRSLSQKNNNREVECKKACLPLHRSTYIYKSQEIRPTKTGLTWGGGCKTINNNKQKRKTLYVQVAGSLISFLRLTEAVPIGHVSPIAAAAAPTWWTVSAAAASWLTAVIGRSAAATAGSRRPAVIGVIGAIAALHNQEVVLAAAVVAAHVIGGWPGQTVGTHEAGYHVWAAPGHQRLRVRSFLSLLAVLDGKAEFLAKPLGEILPGSVRGGNRRPGRVYNRDSRGRGRREHGRLSRPTGSRDGLRITPALFQTGTQRYTRTNWNQKVKIRKT